MSAAIPAKLLVIRKYGDYDALYRHFYDEHAGRRQ
jgi:hypothetical protein